MLLVDETDKADVEVEGLLLEVLSDFQVTIPELGTLVASRRPFVVLTSNASRELSEALKRRCLYLHLDYPSAEREKAIVLSRVPELPAELADQLVRTVRALRALELKKSPSIAETIDWAPHAAGARAWTPSTRRPSPTPSASCSSTSATRPAPPRSSS